ncbi:MAG: type II toxin-antitoxin system HicA family toxin [Paracoccaceae bacterium]
MDDFYREVTALLRSHGFTRTDGGKGSHEKWFNDVTRRLVIVPRNLKSRHTANGILKSAQINRKV